MSKLLSCPFCRELYVGGEARRCTHCDIDLVPFESLPPSLDGDAERAELGLLDPPEDRPLGAAYFGRGRGALLVTSLAGLALFFQPWVTLHAPEEVTLSAFDLARGGVPWLFGGAVGWFLLLPLVWTRQSVTDLRGARVIAATFPAMTLGETLLLLLRPPAEHGYFSSGLEYDWGLYASLVVALAGVRLGITLGGAASDLRDVKPLRAPSDRRPGEPIH